MPRPNSYNKDYGGIASITADGETLFIPTEREYSGIKVVHQGEWDPLEYHHPKNQHQDRLKESSEKRQMKPIPRNNTKLEKPKPTTKTVDLSTNTKKLVDPKLDQAHLNDLKNKGLK